MVARRNANRPAVRVDGLKSELESRVPVRKVRLRHRARTGTEKSEVREACQAVRSIRDRGLSLESVLTKTSKVDKTAAL
jgi:hypothetical protein